MHMPQTKTFCNYDGSFYSQSQKFSREQDLVALGSLARRSAISQPLCLQYYRILLGEGQSPLYSSLKRHNKEYPIAFCYMSYSYIVVQVFVLKKPDGLHCRTVISSRYIREPRMPSSIRSQSKKIALKTSLQSAASYYLAVVRVESYQAKIQKSAI